jgi:hypothetical protein
MEDFENLKEMLDKNAVRLEGATILALDPSSSCTGYRLASVDFKKKTAKITKAGVLWFGKDWSHAQKYHYMMRSLLEYFYVLEAIDHVVIERYSINDRKMSGVLVNPELQGAIKGALYEHEIIVDSIPPQTWRSKLGIKKDKAKNDYKGPTKTYINSVLTNIPDKVTSNITGKERSTPSDFYDSIGVMAGWLTKLGIKVTNSELDQVNPHIGFPMEEAV